MVSHEIKDRQENRWITIQKGRWNDNNEQVITSEDVDKCNEMIDEALRLLEDHFHE